MYISSLNQRMWLHEKGESFQLLIGIIILNFLFHFNAINLFVSGVAEMF